MHPFEELLGSMAEEIELELRGQTSVPWQVFYDKAYGLSLSDAEELFASGLVEPTEQSYSLPGGGSKKKRAYFTPYQYAYELGESREDPELVPDYIEDKNGHILPYVKFRGGSLRLSEEALKVLESAARR